MSADEIRDALAKMTPGDWDLDTGHEIVGADCAPVAQAAFDSALVFRSEDECVANAAGIVTLRNLTGPALDALQAERDAAVARAEKAESEVAQLRGVLKLIASNAPAEKPEGPFDQYGGYISDNYGDVAAAASAEADWYTAQMARSALKEL